MSTSDIKLCYGCMSRITPDESKVCPHCGYAYNTPADIDFLLPGSVLENRYIVGQMKTSDPEGVTYIGLDTELQIRVWIKEYMPLEVCTRNHSTHEVCSIPGFEAQYKSFAQGFKDMALHLQELDCSSLIQPYACAEANGTVYAVYRYISSISLAEFLMSGDGELPWSTAKKLFMPVLNNLSTLHKHGIIHGGISPSSLSIDQHGNVYLGNLGLSGIFDYEVTADNPDKGYHAPEQFFRSGFQGPWTDVYSMGAVLYKCLTGTMPTDALTRRAGNKLLSISQLGGGDIPENVSLAVECAMSLQKEDRPQTIDAFIGKLLECESSNTAIYTAPRPSANLDAVRILDEEDEEEALLPDIEEPSESLISEHSDASLSGAVPSTAKFISNITMMAFIIILLAGIGFVFVFRESIFPAPEPEEQEEELQEEESQIPTLPLPVFEGKYVDSVITSKEYLNHFSFQVEESYNEEYPQGMIYRQNPQPGAEVSDKSSVTLYVSRGSKMIELPDLVGSNLEYADRILSQQGISYELVEIERPTEQDNVILETQPPANSKIDKDSDIILLYIKKSDGEEPPKEGEENGEAPSEKPSEESNSHRPEEAPSEKPTEVKPSSQDREASDKNKVSESENSKTFYG